MLSYGEPREPDDYEGLDLDLDLDYCDLER